MGQFILMKVLVLPVSLQLTVAVYFRQSDLVCNEQTCTCEGKNIGPGIKGDFVHDDRIEDVEISDLLATQAKSFWDFKAFQNGEEVQMKTFKSKLALVVNVASG